jgi:hypothetical protein
MEMGPEALALYDPSDAHKEWKRWCDPLLEAKTVFDCE